MITDQLGTIMTISAVKINGELQLFQHSMSASDFDAVLNMIDSLHTFKVGDAEDNIVRVVNALNYTCVPYEFAEHSQNIAEIK